jgi:hypothetical protein
VIEWIDIDRAVDKYNAALRRKLGIEEGTGLSFDFMPRLVGNTMPDPGVSVTEGYFSFGLSRSF